MTSMGQKLMAIEVMAVFIDHIAEDRPKTSPPNICVEVSPTSTSRLVIPASGLRGKVVTMFDQRFTGSRFWASLSSASPPPTPHAFPDAPSASA